MRKTMTTLLAAALLVAAAATVVAIGGSAAEAEEPPAPPAPRWELDDGDGAPFGFGRGMRAGFMPAEFWEDGFLDAEEIAQLPDRHPLRAEDGVGAAFLDDGVLTEAEHEQLRAQHREMYEARAAQRAEHRAAAEGQWQARADFRAQHRADCDLYDGCDNEPLGPGPRGPGSGRQGPKV